MSLSITPQWKAVETEMFAVTLVTGLQFLDQMSGHYSLGHVELRHVMAYYSRVKSYKN